MAKNSLTYPEPKAHYIYALIDPRTEAVYYVGQTVDTRGRMYKHISVSDEHPAAGKTKNILSAGLKPQMVILDQIETLHLEIALRLEECWRIEMLRNDETLLNIWKTGRCVDTNNPMAEAALIKTYALATPEQMIELQELDKQRAFNLVFG